MSPGYEAWSRKEKGGWGEGLGMTGAGVVLTPRSLDKI